MDVYKADRMFLARIFLALRLPASTRRRSLQGARCRADRVEQRAAHLCLTTSPLSPSPAHLDKCTTCQIRLGTVGRTDQKKKTARARKESPRRHTRRLLSIPYLYVYLLIDPICAYLISRSIVLSPAICPSLPLSLAASI